MNNLDPYQVDMCVYVCMGLMVDLHIMPGPCNNIVLFFFDRHASCICMQSVSLSCGYNCIIHCIYRKSRNFRWKNVILIFVASIDHENIFTTKISRFTVT